MIHASKALRLALCLLAVPATTTSEARAAELEGVTLPGSVEISGQELTLNGMGLRKKLFIKVYVAGLYLPSSQQDPRAILAADTARHLVMRFKFEVGAEKMCGAWEDGLEDNTPDASIELEQQFETLCTWMDDLEKTDEMTVTYVPGQGTTIEVKGAVKGTIEGKPFADALFACWLGPEPPSSGLKEGLLGS